jgi:catalase-peroxidase
LTNDFFVNLLDAGTRWEPTSPEEEAFTGCDVARAPRWTASRVGPVPRVELAAAGVG